jgi:hypothetical protein
MSRDFARISASGPVRYGQLPGSVGVLEALDKPMPLGIASCIGWEPAGLAVWRLSIDDQDVPGRWIIVDRKFRPVEACASTSKS